MIVYKNKCKMQYKQCIKNMNKISFSAYFFAFDIVFTLFKCYNYHSGDSYEKVL